MSHTVSIIGSSVLSSPFKDTATHFFPHAHALGMGLGLVEGAFEFIGGGFTMLMTDG